MHSTFLNYLPEDEALAKRIYADLLAAGIRPWMAIYDIMPSENPAKAQEKALEASKAMIVIVTKKYVRSKDAVRLTEAAKKAGKKIIPVLADRGIALPSGLPGPIQLKRRYSEAVQEIIAQLPADQPPLKEIPPLQRGNEAFAIGDYEGALKAYKEAKEENVTIFNCRAAAYNALRQHEEALAELNRAVELDPNSDLAYRSRALAYAGMGRYDEALLDDTKAIELDPNSPFNWSSCAMTLAALEQYEDAQAAIETALGYVPDEPLYHYQLGYILGKAGQYEEALNAYNRALELNPAYTEAMIGRRMMLGRLGRYDEALAEVDKEIRQNPRKSSHYITRSLINFYLERYEEAVNDATAALERGGQLPALYNRAIALWRMGEQDKAHQDFLKGIQLHPPLGTERYIRQNAESELTYQAGMEILESLKANGLLKD